MSFKCVDFRKVIKRFYMEMQVQASLVCPFVSCVLRSFQCTEKDTKYTLDLVFNQHTGADQKKMATLVPEHTGSLKGRLFKDADAVFAELVLSGIVSVYLSRGARAMMYQLLPGLANPMFEIHFTVTMRGECHLVLLRRTLGSDNMVTSSLPLAHHVLRLPIGSSMHESLIVFYDMQRDIERQFAYKNYLSAFRTNLNLAITKKTETKSMSQTTSKTDRKIVVPVRRVAVAGDVRSIDEKTFLMMMHMYHAKGDSASIQEAVLARGLAPKGVSRWLQILSGTSKEQEEQFAKLMRGDVSLLEYTELLAK